MSEEQVPSSVSLSKEALAKYLRLRMLLESMDPSDPRRESTDEELTSIWNTAEPAQRLKMVGLDNKLREVSEGFLVEDDDKKLLRAALLYNLCILPSVLGVHPDILTLRDKVTEYLNTKGFPVPTISPGSKLDDLLFELGKEFL